MASEKKGKKGKNAPAEEVDIKPNNVSDPPPYYYLYNKRVTSHYRHDTLLHALNCTSKGCVLKLHFLPNKISFQFHV